MTDGKIGLTKEQIDGIVKYAADCYEILPDGHPAESVCMFVQALAMEVDRLQYELAKEQARSGQVHPEQDGWIASKMVEIHLDTESTEG